jgi:hypothetical protein
MHRQSPNRHTLPRTLAPPKHPTRPDRAPPPPKRSRQRPAQRPTSHHHHRHSPPQWRRELTQAAELPRGSVLGQGMDRPAQAIGGGGAGVGAAELECGCEENLPQYVYEFCCSQYSEEEQVILMMSSSDPGRL